MRNALDGSSDTQIDSDAYGTNAGATNMKGTFYWMAVSDSFETFGSNVDALIQPEVIDSVGMTGYSAKCDIWSLGCVLLEMFTAERPWPKMTMVQIVMEVSGISTKWRFSKCF